MPKGLTYQKEVVEICKDCYGTGEINSPEGPFKFKKCKKCEGKGWVKDEQDTRNK